MGLLRLWHETGMRTFDTELPGAIPNIRDRGRRSRMAQWVETMDGRNIIVGNDFWTARWRNAPAMDDIGAYPCLSAINKDAPLVGASLFLGQIFIGNYAERL